MLVIVKNLLTQLIDQLVKAQVDLGFYLIVQKLPPKVVQSIVGGVTVEVQGVQDVFHHVSFFVLQDVVGQNPW